MVAVLLTRVFDRFAQRPIKSKVYRVCNIRQSQFVHVVTVIYLFILLFLQDGLQCRARQFDLIVGLCLMVSCDEPTRLLPKPSRRKSKVFFLPKKSPLMPILALLST